MIDDENYTIKHTVPADHGWRVVGWDGETKENITLEISPVIAWATIAGYFANGGDGVLPVYVPSGNGSLPPQPGLPYQFLGFIAPCEAVDCDAWMSEAHADFKAKTMRREKEKTKPVPQSAGY